MANAVIDKLSDPVLKDIAATCSYDYDTSESSTDISLEIRKEIIYEITNLGIKQFIAHLKKDDLEEFTKKIRKSVLTSHNQNSITLSVLRKRLLETIEEKGFGHYMSKLNPQPRLLRAGIRSMTGEVVSKNLTQTELMDMMTNEILMFGFEEYLMRFNTLFLQKMCSDIGITVKSTSKTVFARSIANQTDHLPEKKTLKKKNTKKKIVQKVDDTSELTKENEKSSSDTDSYPVDNTKKQKLKQDNEKENKEKERKRAKEQEDDPPKEKLKSSKNEKEPLVAQKEKNKIKNQKEKNDENDDMEGEVIQTYTSVKENNKNKNIKKEVVQDSKKSSQKDERKEQGDDVKGKNMSLRLDEDSESGSSSSHNQKKRKNIVEEKPVNKKDKKQT